MTRVICFDTETTGFNYKGGDRIIEIGAVEIQDGKITNNNFHEYINPDGKIIPTESYMVHKISNEFLTDKPKMKDVAQKFLDFIGDSMIVAHNGFDFDFPFLNHELKVLRLAEIPKSQQQDSIVIARHRVFGPKTYTLDALAKWFGVSLTARADAHGALIDSEILARVYLELDNTAEAKDIKEIIAEQLKAMEKHQKTNLIFPKRSFKPSDKEIARHTEFIQKITA